MRIGDLACAVGADTGTGYCERQGLLPLPDRGATGYRRYGALHLQCLAYVHHGRALDLLLAHVRTLPDFIAQPQPRCGGVDALVDAYLSCVRARMAWMHTL